MSEQAASEPEIDWDALRRQMREGASTPLVSWLQDHQSEMRQLTSGRRVSWVAVQEALAGYGVLKKDGAPVRKESIRKAWIRVREQSRNKEVIQ